MGEKNKISFEITDEIRVFFEETINKFSTPDVEFIPAEIDKEWLLKRRFDLDIKEIIEAFKGGELLKENKIQQPYFVDDLMPISGAKYIKTENDFYAGNVLKYTIEVGEVGKFPHNPQHLKYNSDKKHRKSITMNYQPDKERWGYINEEDWEELKIELLEYQQHEWVYQTEKYIKKLMRQGRAAVRDFEEAKNIEALDKLLDILEFNKYLFYIMPSLWQCYKLITRKHKKIIYRKIKYCYDFWYDIIDTRNKNTKTDIIDFTIYPKVIEFIASCKSLFDKGYYFDVQNESITAHPNISMIYTIHEQQKNYVKPDYVESCKAKAEEIAAKDNLKHFLPLNDITKALKIKKKE